MINEKTIQKFFKDKKSTGRIFKDISALDNLCSQFNIEIQESTLGINIIVSIDTSLLGLKKLNDRKIVIVVYLNENYPTYPPRTFCKTKFSFPTIADGRDLTDDILQKPYMSNMALYQFIQMFPQFIKKICQKEGDLNQMEDVGVFHINEKYDIDEILTLEGIEILETTEVTAKKSKEKRCLVISEQHLLVFNVVNADESIGILLNWFFLQSMHKVDRKEQKFTLTFSQKKDTKLTLIFEDADSFQSLLEKKMSQIELGVINFQKKKSFNKVDVTVQFYENMDLKQIRENIVICENQLKYQLSIDLVNTLSILYQKAIEYLSAVGDMNFKIFIDKMQDLLSREDIQTLLQIQELEKGGKIQPSQDQNQQPEASNQVPQPVQVQEINDSLLDSDYVQLSKFPSKSIDLSNQDRFVLIDKQFRGDYELKRYYDNIEKRIISNKQYSQSFEEQYIEEISIYECYYDNQFMIKILDINQLSLNFQDGQTTLQGYKIQRDRMSSLTEEEIFTIALRILSLLKYCRTHQIFPVNFTDLDLVLEPTSIYNEYVVKFGSGCQFYKIDRVSTLQIISRAYYKQEFLDLIVGQKQLKTDKATLNYMFSLGRILQKLILKEGELEFFKRTNIETFLDGWKEKYPLLIRLVGNLLTSEFKDYEEIEIIVNQYITERKQTLTDQQGACQICYENQLFNPIQMMLKKSIIKKYQYHEIHNLKPSSIYFLNLIGDPKSDLQGLIFSQSVPRLAVLLQKYTDPHLQKILNQFKNIFINYPNVMLEQQVFEGVELKYSYQFFTLGIFMVLLLTRMGFLSQAAKLSVSLISSAREIYQDNHTILSDILMITSYVYKQQGLYNLALQLACESYTMRRILQGDSNPSLFFSYFFISKIFLLLKKNEFSLEWIQNIPIDWKNQYVYNSLEIQGRCLLEQKQVQAALQLYTQAQKIQDLSYFHQVKNLKLIGKTYQLLGKSQEAINYAQQALLLATQTNEDHAFIAKCMHFVGKIMLKNKLYAESARHHLKALEIKQQILGGNHLDISQSYCNLGKVYFQTRELDESAKYFMQGLQIRTLNASLSHIKTITFIEHLIYIYTQQHKEDNLLDVYSQYDEVYMNVYGNSSDNYIHFLQRKADVLEKIQAGLGIEIREEILMILKNNENSDGVTDQLKITQQIINIGISYHQNANFEKAYELKKEGYEKAKNLLGNKSIKLIQIQLSLLETCKELCLYDDSIAYFQQALQLSKDINLEDEQVVKIINQMANFCVDLMGQVKLEEAFQLNDKIQVVIIAVYGDSSPYLEMQSQIMQNSMNSII